MSLVEELNITLKDLFPFATILRRLQEEIHAPRISGRNIRERKC